jgi:hypothetical protein
VQVSARSDSYHQTQIGADYYDEKADAQKRNDYYAALQDRFQKSDGQELFSQLHHLLKSTHISRGQLPAEALYARVDRRPDGALYPLYGGQGPKNEVQVKSRNNRDLEGYNLEHLVPKSWFEGQNPMRDDLHHLYTEDRQINSDRGNLPLRRAPGQPSQSVVETPQGPAYQPKAGWGEAARSILYFVTRHPGYVGDQPDELTPADIPQLLEWHREYPVTDYERHRNEATQAEQGNRNPYIDFPELAERVDFRPGFADFKKT